VPLGLELGLGSEELREFERLGAPAPIARPDPTSDSTFARSAAIRRPSSSMFISPPHGLSLRVHASAPGHAGHQDAGGQIGTARSVLMVSPTPGDWPFQKTFAAA
jgi:hypothetical protein